MMHASPAECQIEKMLQIILAAAMIVPNAGNLRNLSLLNVPACFRHTLCVGIACTKLDGYSDLHCNGNGGSAQTEAGMSQH